jgi:hypothetical protein
VVEYINSGSGTSYRTGAIGGALVSSTKPDLDSAFHLLGQRFAPNWTGDEIVSQDSKFFTAESKTLSKDEINGLIAGTMGLYVLGIVRFSDATGEYQQDFCNWSQPPGNTLAWHGCGVHESETKIN